MATATEQSSLGAQHIVCNSLYSLKELTGHYGSSFAAAGDGEWGVGSMQHDLTDAVQWAVATGIADPQRVCIMGASYGGYATFAGEQPLL